MLFANLALKVGEDVHGCVGIIVIMEIEETKIGQVCRVSTVNGSNVWGQHRSTLRKRQLLRLVVVPIIGRALYLETFRLWNKYSCRV